MEYQELDDPLNSINLINLEISDEDEDQNKFKKKYLSNFLN